MSEHQFKIKAILDSQQVQQEIYDTPMLTLMLLMRQKLAQEGKAGISLQDKEILDNTSWDELLRRNREALYKQLNKCN